jgi:hypothetical protein
MSILELTILPPLAIARLGSSQHPLEELLEVPDDGLDFRRITPAETLYVDASSGEIADARTRSFFAAAITSVRSRRFLKCSHAPLRTGSNR